LATNPKFSNLCVNGEADFIGTALNTGFIRIYTGAQPTDADTAVGAQTLLATLRFGATAFPAAVAGVLTANAITSDTNAAATGTAAWARLLKSDGTSVVMDGTVGTSAANVVINAVAISAGATVSCSSLTITISKG
jgi:hypothetical protein